MRNTNLVCKSDRREFNGKQKKIKIKITAGKSSNIVMSQIATEICCLTIGKFEKGMLSEKVQLGTNTSKRWLNK